MALVTWRGSVEWAAAAPLLQFAVPLVLLEAILGLSSRESLHRLTWLPSAARTAAYGVLFYLFAFHGASAQTFIYFQF